MESTTALSLEQYLDSSYRPDCDLVDGKLVHRSVGLRTHGVCVGNLAFVFYQRRTEWRLQPLISQRIQVSASRVRVADLCAVRRNDPKDAVVIHPPLLCVEVLTPQDTMGDLHERVSDYIAMGVENIWALDPWKHFAWYCSPKGFLQPEDGFLRVEGTPIAVSLAAVFAELEKADQLIDAEG